MIKWFKIYLCLLLLVFANVVFSQTVQDDSPQKKSETKLTEVVITDSIDANELIKRAINWVKLESAKYGKTNGVSAGSKAECTVTFPVKPKEINPVCNYAGKIIMRVVIECKNSKYKYTIDHIKHFSANEKSSAGSIDNEVPECGTMLMTTIVWKKLRGEALVKANSVVADIKEAMKINSASIGKEEW
jgi:hypothetical protein